MHPKRITSSALVISTALAASLLAPSAGALAARAHPSANQPVCGWREDGPRTYENASLAARDHAHVIHLGACQPITCWSWAGVFRSGPMCGIDPLSKVRMTYPNICAAEHAQAIWVHEGACAGRR